MSKTAHRDAVSGHPGVIEPAAFYTLAEVSGRSGLGTWALRTLRRNGLKVYRFGGRGFVRGADFIAAILAADGEDGGRRQ